MAALVQRCADLDLIDWQSLTLVLVKWASPWIQMSALHLPRVGMQVTPALCCYITGVLWLKDLNPSHIWASVLITQRKKKTNQAAGRRRHWCAASIFGFLLRSMLSLSGVFCEFSPEVTHCWVHINHFSTAAMPRRRGEFYSPYWVMPLHL